MDAILLHHGQSTPATHQEEHYCIIVEGYQLLSRLLRINRESRDAALSFYRIRLPCWITKDVSSVDGLAPGTVYYNPKYEFLQVMPENMDVVEFFYDLKSKYDPRRISLLNFAVEETQLDREAGLITSRWRQNSPALRKAFIETISQLEEVFFVSVQKVVRQVLGRDAGALTMDKSIFNRSFPIMAQALKFDRISRDPRSIGHDLSNLFISRNPRSLLDSWQRMLDTLDINPSRAQYRILLAFEPIGSQNAIFDRKSAEKWLQKEDDLWTGSHQPTGPFSSLNLKKIAPAQLGEFRQDQGEAVKPAIGFWLFPIETFPEQSSTGPRTFIYNVVEHWPELGLFRVHE
ncbi:putative 2EXR domain-containing protein [Seiridium cardinale]|uniref:2EXR domain-containing protein n=1 Tax=Seiridium cardinale TaxID=138064 RepID=A0ABR2XM99_9PEZI